MAAQISGNQRLKIRAPFDAIDGRSACILQAERAHPARIFALEPRPNTASCFAYGAVVNLLGTNSGSDFVQHVFKFFLLHDFTPMIANINSVSFGGGLLPAPERGSPPLND